MELTRIGASPEFRAAPRLREFLRFITEEALAGRAGQIKEYSVGTTVYGKDASYDPRLDSTVRVEAAKLRSRLTQYYERSGQDDPVRISMPKGGYVPLFDNGPTASEPRRVQNAGSLPSIAVLPFLNLSADPENDYFSDGLVEELTAALTRSNIMRVAPRTAVFHFKGTHPELREIHRLLNVDRVLEGTVRKCGDRLRITVQLADVPGCCQLWSQTYDRTLADVFAIQDEIAREVVLLVCGAESRGALVRSHTPRVEAFDLYLRGRHLVYRWDSNAEQQALNLFEQAIAADPEYPLAHVGVAEAVVCLAMFGVASPVELLPRAHAALHRALQLDPALAEAHVARATVLARYEWDWAAAEKEYRLAIRMAPGLAQAHHEYATELLATNGRYDEAYAEWRRARELDPFSPAIAYGHAWILIHQRRFLESEQEFRRLLDSGAVYETERVGLAFALAGQRKYDESLNEYTRIIARDASPSHACICAWLQALAGQTRAARCRLSELETMAESRYIPASLLAQIHFALADTDRGFELLEQAIAHKEPALRSLKEGFDWDPIRMDPRFSTLLRRLWPEL